MIITKEEETLKMPDFLLVGAAKSGTTSLYHYLAQSPEIFLTPEKEPHFFSFYNNPPAFNSPETLPTVHSDIPSYQKLFKNAKEGQLLGEASQSYLFMYERVIANMKEIYGTRYKDVKIVIVLRNPVERAWSQYWHFKKNFNEPLPFDEAISVDTLQSRKENNWNVFYQYLDFGNYTAQVKAYQDHFSNVKVFLHDELKENTPALMQELFQFFGVEPMEIDHNRNFNPSGLPKKNIYGALWKLNVQKKRLKPLKNVLPKKLRKKLSDKLLEKSLERQQLPLDTRELLNQYYKKEIEKLHELLSKKEILNWLK